MVVPDTWTSNGRRIMAIITDITTNILLNIMDGPKLRYHVFRTRVQRWAQAPLPRFDGPRLRYHVLTSPSSATMF